MAATHAKPSSVAEGELWVLINSFHKTLEKIRTDAAVCNSAPTAEAAFTTSLKDLRQRLLGICDSVDVLEATFQKQESDAQAVLGNGNDVETQIECAKNLLASLQDVSLKAQLEDQPLDQRSASTREKLRKKIDDINRFCTELEKHIRLMRDGAPPVAYVVSACGVGVNVARRHNSSAQLFKVLKINYESSKREYNRALDLADRMKSLSLKASSRALVRAPAPPPVPGKELLRQLRQEEDGLQKLQSVFGVMTPTTITPRDISSVVRRQPPRREALPVKPEPVPAVATRPSQLFSSTKTSIPTQTAQAGSLSFQQMAKPTPVPQVAAKTKVEPKVEAKAESKAETAKPASTFSFNPEGKTESSFAFKPEVKAGAASEKSKPIKVASPAFSFSKPSDPSKSPLRKPSPLSTMGSLSFGESSSDDVESPRVRKMSTASNGSKTPQKPVAFSFQTPKSAALKTENATDVKSPSLGGIAKRVEPTPLKLSEPVNYLERMKSFYNKHGGGKIIAQAVMEKNLNDNKGKEADLFLRLLKKYISQEATLEQAKEYLDTGVVPASLLSKAAPSFVAAGVTAGSQAFRSAAAPSTGFGFGATTPSTTASPFGTAAKPAAPVPFGAATTPSSPSPFGQPAPTPASPFGQPPSSPAPSSPFGQTPSSPAPSSPFGQTPPTPFGQATPAFGATDHRTRLVEFYTKHNPAKLSEVDNLLARYRGKEDTLFKSLETKYGGGAAAKPATGFGAAPAFGSSASSTPAASPFGTTSSFGSSAPAAFGAATPAFGAPSAFGSTTPASPAFGATAPLATSAFGSNNSMAASAAPAFGSATPLGASATPAFGASTSLGASASPAFGAPTPLGGGFGATSAFGAAAPAATSSTGGGFAGFAAGVAAPSFGSFGAQQSMGFGAAAPSGFGSTSSFGGSGFGQTSSFSSPSFTKMR
ncbi:nuclear pore complex protein [Achlya hypogyna]|uniref:Nuclear pore complex protein n=1 Tax=Achlya hypogyna TaxID=1202772 RepID=A0A1V9ZDF8_ACHHY|nr:nuclear pore complex protein [Achlya hypogyna]